MKYIILICIGFFTTNQLLAQTNRYSEPAKTNFNDFNYAPYVPQYIPTNNDDLLIQLAATLQARYDQNKKYRGDLIKWVFDLKSKTNEKEFTSVLDEAYSKLRAMDNGAFEKLGSDLDNIKFKISSTLLNLNS